MTAALRPLDIGAVESTLRETGACRLPAGDYACARAITLPTGRGVRLSGDGPGVTRLFCDGADGIVSEVRSTAYTTAIIEGLSIYATKNAGDGIRIVRDWKVRAHDPQVILRDLHVAPAPGGEFAASWRRMFALDGVWGPKLMNCWAVGNFDGVPYDALKAGHAAVGFEVGGSQEAKITDCYIACVQTGVHVDARDAGCGEGLGLAGTTIINCLTCVRAEGKGAGVYGPFATPYLTISGCHLFYLHYGVFLTDRYSVSLRGNDICGSHLTPKAVGGYGLFVAGNSRNIRVEGNNFYAAIPGRATGVIVDASSDGVIQGNTFDKSLAAGVILTPANGPVSGWDVRGNVCRCAWPVIDAGKGNRIEAA